LQLEVSALNKAQEPLPKKPAHEKWIMIFNVPIKKMGCFYMIVLEKM
jgi:hypothetical protein